MSGCEGLMKAEQLSEWAAERDERMVIVGKDPLHKTVSARRVETSF